MTPCVILYIVFLTKRRHIVKHEWRKHEKALYLPGNTPTSIIVPTCKFFMISGKGNPNSDNFKKHIEALYALSYAIRMSYKWDNPPENYSEYTVYPLEGVWDIADKSKYIEGQIDKNNLAYNIMIRQPEFVTSVFAEKTIEIVQSKKPNLIPTNIEFGEFTEGKCVQMLHIGSYDDEPESFKRMEAFAKTINLKRTFKTHREIYISDPRKTKAEKLKTVLRFKVKEI